MKTIFDSNLLKTIPDLLKKSAYQISVYISSCSHDTLNRNFKSGDMRFCTFIELCYAWHINPFAFFHKPGQDIDISTVMVTDDNYPEIEFKPEYIENYSNKAEFIRCSELAKYISSHRVKWQLPITIDGTFASADIFSTVKHEDAKPEEKDTEEHIVHYIYNNTLMVALPSLLNIDKKQVGISINRSINFHMYAITNKNVRMTSLVELCNAHRLDINLFFSDHEYLPIDIIVPEDKWKPVMFYPERIMDFAENRTQHKMLEALSWTKQRLYRSAASNSTMSALDLLDVCNKFGVPPSYFFEAPSVASSQRVARKLNKRIEDQEEKIKQLNIEKRMLESKLRHEKAMRKFSGADN